MNERAHAQLKGESWFAKAPRLPFFPSFFPKRIGISILDEKGRRRSVYQSIAYSDVLVALNAPLVRLNCVMYPTDIQPFARQPASDSAMSCEFGKDPFTQKVERNSFGSRKCDDAFLNYANSNRGQDNKFAVHGSSPPVFLQTQPQKSRKPTTSNGKYKKNLRLYCDKIQGRMYILCTEAAVNL